MHYDSRRGLLADCPPEVSFTEAFSRLTRGPVPDFSQAIAPVFARVSPPALSVIGSVARAAGKPLCAAEAARRSGLRDRHQLARVLKRDHLPPYEELVAWLSVTAWLHAAEAGRKSLFSIATQIEREPATCYRMVKRITGLPWQAACRRGFGWQLTRLLARCGNDPPAEAVEADWNGG